MTEHFAYEITVADKQDSTTYRTNDFDKAIETLCSCAERGVPIHMIDGMTGEVLAAQNIEGADDYLCPWMVYAVYGYYAFENMI